MSAIEVSKLPDMPSSPAFIKKRNRDHDFDRRAAAIIEERKLNNSGRKRITSQAWEHFLIGVGNVCVKELCLQPGMPSEAAVYKRRKRDPAFDRRFADTFRQRRATAIRARLFSRFPGMRRLYDRSQDRDWTIGELAATPRPPIFQRSFQEVLSSNELYKRALAAVPAHINPNDRADIAADIVLAVLRWRGHHQTPEHREIFGRSCRTYASASSASRSTARPRPLSRICLPVGDSITNEQYQDFWAEAAG